jgi:small subunit ribosomal protein S17
MKTERNDRKVREGLVISDTMAKTRVVVVKRQFKHPMFGKIISKTKKFYVHDEKEVAKTGDRVAIMETRPLSKLKRWRIVEVLEKAK